MIDCTEDRQLPRLPACQSCYARKAKCDNARPKCLPCTKSGQPCMTLSLDGGDSVSREYIYELELNVRHLEAETTTTESSPNNTQHLSPGVLADDTPDHQENDAHQTLDVAPNDVSLSPNFTEGAGISFISLLFTDSRWREQNQKLLHNLSKPATIIETGVQPNSLPPAEEALVVFNSYLSSSHVQNPFLLRRHVQELYHGVFAMEAGDHPQPTQSTDHLSKHDLFRTFMVLAIGSVPLYRTGKHTKHPYGYFLTAMQQVETDLLTRGLDSIQDLLLVSRFGIYHHIGTSIWEIIQLCMRMCIEQGLHGNRKRATKGTTSLLQEQLERRIFWQCYMMNRYSSVMLDRPPAIADQDIEVGFPTDADDEDLDLADESGTFQDLDSYCRATAVRPSLARTTEMSVFFICLRLRSITSKIHSKFQQKANPPGRHELSPIELVMASGVIYANLDELLAELEQWRVTTPVFATPRCLYETQEWYDLLLMRERLLLVRKAIDLMPKRNKTPPRDLLSLCLEFSVGTIMTFYPLFEQKRVTYTRSYFQTLFTAGLSVMFCVSVVADLDSQAIRSAKEAVETCERILKIMVRELPDAVHYVAVYEALKVDILGKLNRAINDNTVPVDIGLETHMPLNNTDQQIGGTGPMQSSNRESERQVLEMHQPNTQFHPYWPFLTPDDSEIEPQLGAHEPVIDSSLLSWEFFGDNIFWNIEAGMLGEYVYGDPNVGSLLDDSI